MKRGFTYYIQDKSDKNLIYYGSSEMPTLKDRLDTHIRSFNSWKNTGIGYCSSFKILEINNYKYDIIEIVYFDTKQELREYERPLIEGQVCVNERIPNRSDAEYYQDHKEYYKEYKSKYYQDNKDKLADYYQNNKEKIKQQHADYYQNNKEKFKEQQNKKITCPCGGRYTHQNKSQHNKSNKHQKWALSQTSKNE